MAVSISLASPFAAQILARTGVDILFIDAEHSPLSPAVVTSMVHSCIAVSHGFCMPLVRVPSPHSDEWLKWSLDSGAAGVIVPMVHDVSTAKELVRRAKYPPLGGRGLGPFQAEFVELMAENDKDLTSAGTGWLRYVDKTVKNVVLIVMIESRSGVHNVDEILAIDGVDGVFVGANDLRFEMGLPGASGSEPQYLAALEKVATSARNLGKPAGAFSADAESTAKLLEFGFTWFLAAGDEWLLANGARLALSSFRQVQRHIGTTGPKAVL